MSRWAEEGEDGHGNGGQTSLPDGGGMNTGLGVEEGRQRDDGRAVESESATKRRRNRIKSAGASSSFSSCPF
jgi:hypothetical protein